MLLFLSYNNFLCRILEDIFGAIVVSIEYAQAHADATFGRTLFIQYVSSCTRWLGVLLEAFGLLDHYSKIESPLTIPDIVLSLPE